MTGYLVPEEDDQMFPMEDMTDEEDEERVPPLAADPNASDLSCSWHRF